MFKPINVYYNDYRMEDYTGWVCYNCDLLKFQELCSLQEDGLIEILGTTKGTIN